MNRPSMRQLAMIFLRYGNVTFGGGSATIGVLQTKLIDRHHWIDQEQFALSFSLARLTPGTNLLSFVAGVGWLLRGIRGSIIALLAGSIPCSLIALLVTFVYSRFSQNPIVMISLRGALAAAVGVMIATGWTLMRPFWKSTSILRLVAFTGGALVLGFFSFSPIRVLLCAALVGFCCPQREAA